MSGWKKYQMKNIISLNKRCHMRKITIMLLALCLVIGLAACSGSKAAEEPEQPGSSEEEQTESPEDEADGDDAGDTLVVYFSCTGTTKGVAEKIAQVTGSDIYEIKPAKEYTDEDLNWNDDSSRTTIEQNDESARPEIGSEPVSLEKYSTVFIGFPIWWGEEPRIMDTFVESQDFDGKTVIPFCTSGGSPIGNSGKNLEKNAGSGNWLDGERFDGSVPEETLKSWIDGLK